MPWCHEVLAIFLKLTHQPINWHAETGHSSYTVLHKKECPINLLPQNNTKDDHLWWIQLMLNDLVWVSVSHMSALCLSTLLLKWNIHCWKLTSQQKSSSLISLWNSIKNWCWMTLSWVFTKACSRCNLYGHEQRNPKQMPQCCLQYLHLTTSLLKRFLWTALKCLVNFLHLLSWCWWTHLHFVAQRQSISSKWWYHLQINDVLEVGSFLKHAWELCCIAAALLGFWKFQQIKLFFCSWFHHLAHRGL